MDNIIFGSTREEQTLVVFSLVLFAFVLFPLTYQFASPKTYNSLRKRSVLADWRCMVPVVFYALILGFRYDYSFDWDQYKSTFEFLQRGILYRDDTERGYLYINSLLIKAGFNYYSIFILEGLVYALSYFVLMKDYRKRLVFVLPLVYLAQFSNCLNISRQFFSMSIFLIGFRYLIDGKKIAYVIFSVVAGTIHTIALVWAVPFYFIKYLSGIKLHFKWLLLSCLVLNLATSLIQHWLFNQLSLLYMVMNFKEAYTETLLGDKYMRETMTLSMFLVRLIKSVAYLYLFKRQEEKGVFANHPTLRIYVYLGAIALPFTVLFASHELFLRFFFFITVFTDIGWGILTYNMVGCFKKLRLSPLVTLVAVVCVFHYVWAFYAQIIAGFSNSRTNLFIIYKDFLQFTF